MDRKLLSNSEALVAVVIVVISAMISMRNSAFLSLGNLFDILRSSIVMGIFGAGCLLVMISGGTDVSFTTIAAFSMYSAVKILIESGFTGSILVAFVLSAAIGTALGLINGLFVSLFNLPTIIVTLGTSAMFRGFLLTFIGSSAYYSLPERIGIVQFSRANLAEVTTQSGLVFTLPASVLILAGVFLAVWAILKYTLLGRGIYAIGGNKTAAERIGFRVRPIQFFVYGFMGFCAGIAGMVQCSMIRSANPVDLMGMELNVIAAVVLGGTSISGGTGTPLGMILGVLLVVIISNSLVLAGIPSYWQKVVLGLLIIIGTSVTAYRSSRELR